MTIRVLFFGSISSITGKRQIEVDLSDATDAQQAVGKVLAAYPDLGAHRLLFSVNQQYATGKESLKDGDELAIFSAVSGG